MADTEETEFAAEPRNAKTFVEEAIAKVRDLEETEFAAEPRDAEVFHYFDLLFLKEIFYQVFVADAIEKVMDLEPSDFSKIFD